MDVGAVLVGSAVLLLCMPWLAKPFLQKSRLVASAEQLASGSGKQANRKEQRQDILFALRDLDFDFETGKVPEVDYRNLRTQLLVHAASLIPDEKVRDDEIEALIQARREQMDLKITCSKCGELAGSDDRFCPTCGSSIDEASKSTDIYCHVCGLKTIPGALFCSHCGTRLASGEAQSSTDP